jgi:hypothetical protein
MPKILSHRVNVHACSALPSMFPHGTLLRNYCIKRVPSCHLAQQRNTRFCLFVCLLACLLAYLFNCRRYTQVDASRTQALQQALSAHRRRPSDDTASADQPTALEESSPEPSPVSQPTSPPGSAVGDSNLTSHLSDDIDELLAEVTAEQRKLRKSKLPPVTIISEV